MSLFQYVYELELWEKFGSMILNELNKGISLGVHEN